jgi:hypothetical protein
LKFQQNKLKKGMKDILFFVSKKKEPWMICFFRVNLVKWKRFKSRKLEKYRRVELHPSLEWSEAAALYKIRRKHETS